MAITLTDKAAQQVQMYLTRRGKGIGLRLGVRTIGCSGLARASACSRATAVST